MFPHIILVADEILVHESVQARFVVLKTLQSTPFLLLKWSSVTTAS